MTAGTVINLSIFDAIQVGFKQSRTLNITIMEHVHSTLILQGTEANIQEFTRSFKAAHRPNCLRENTAEGFVYDILNPKWSFEAMNNMARRTGVTIAYRSTDTTTTILPNALALQEQWRFRFDSRNTTCWPCEPHTECAH